MSTDAPSLEPPKGLSPLATNVLIGALAFAGGIGGTALILHFTAPAPVPVVATPAPAPAPAVAPPDSATLFAREQELAGRLDQLEKRLGEADNGARTAASYANQAERLMISFAVRRAIERGLPLATLEGPLRRRFEQDHRDAVATIVQSAREPVTLEDLRVALDVIAPRLSISPNDGMWSLFRRGLGDLVVLRDAGSPSPRPADRLKRARRALEEGQVEVARAEVMHMPGAANAESWVAAAGRYVAARTALREIEAAAMESAPAPPQPRAG
jgi:hypothetical protein